MTDTTPAPLAPRQATALLGTMPIFLRAEFEAAPKEFLQWRPAPEEWCVQEVVGHLIETEERTCIPPGPPFDQGCAVTSERLFKVLPPDPQRLDHDGDGIGCEPIRAST